MLELVCPDCKMGHSKSVNINRGVPYWGMLISYSISGDGTCAGQ